MPITIKRLVVVFMLLFSCPNFACQGKGSEKDKVLARVGNIVITLEEFNRKFKETESLHGPLVSYRTDIVKNLKEDLLNRLIEEKLIILKADELGIMISKKYLEERIETIKEDYPQQSFQKMFTDEQLDYKRWKEGIKDKLLAGKVIRQELNSLITVQESEAIEYYQRHADQYNLSDQVKARQIVVNTEESALEILEELEGGADFSKLAREKSLSPDGQQGGELGFFARGQMPLEFEEVAFSLLPGKLSEVVTSKYGYHIFLIDEKKKAAEVPFSQVKNEIIEKIWTKKQKKAYRKWMESLKDNVTIRINRELLGF